MRTGRNDDNHSDFHYSRKVNKTGARPRFAPLYLTIDIMCFSTTYSRSDDSRTRNYGACAMRWSHQCSQPSTNLTGWIMDAARHYDVVIRIYVMATNAFMTSSVAGGRGSGVFAYWIVSVVRVITSLCPSCKYLTLLLRDKGSKINSGCVLVGEMEIWTRKISDRGLVPCLRGFV